MEINQKWLRKKLKNLSQKRKWLNMENKEPQEVTIEVTGVSMSGEASINEHNGHIESDKEEPTKEEDRDSK